MVSRNEKKAAVEESVKKIPKITQFFKNEPDDSPLEENKPIEENLPSTSTSPNDRRPDDFPDSSADTETLANDLQIPNRGNDVGLWQKLSEIDIDYWIRKGPSECHHSDGPFDNSTRVFNETTRQCTANIFFGSKMNGERYRREVSLLSANRQCLLFCLFIV